MARTEGRGLGTPGAEEQNGGVGRTGVSEPGSVPKVVTKMTYSLGAVLGAECGSDAELWPSCWETQVTPPVAQI